MIFNLQNDESDEIERRLTKIENKIDSFQNSISGIHESIKELLQKGDDHHNQMIEKYDSK